MWHKQGVHFLSEDGAIQRPHQRLFWQKVERGVLTVSRGESVFVLEVLNQTAAVKIKVCFAELHSSTVFSPLWKMKEEEARFKISGGWWDNFTVGDRHSRLNFCWLNFMEEGAPAGLTHPAQLTRNTTRASEMSPNTSVSACLSKSKWLFLHNWGPIGFHLGLTLTDLFQWEIYLHYRTGLYIDLLI